MDLPPAGRPRHSRRAPALARTETPPSWSSADVIAPGWGALRPGTRIRSRVIRGSSGTDVHIITCPASLTARPAFHAGAPSDWPTVPGCRRAVQPVRGPGRNSGPVFAARFGSAWVACGPDPGAFADLPGDGSRRRESAGIRPVRGPVGGNAPHVPALIERRHRNPEIA